MAASALPVPQLTMAPRAHNASSNSTNWSGYAGTGASGSVSNAKGSWTVPAIQGACPSTNQYSSFWVGIDGFNSGTVVQTGTDSDCQNGTPTYYAWYEFYPHPSFLISGLTIHPGDHITAQANFNGKSFVVTITTQPLDSRSVLPRRLEAHSVLLPNGLQKPHPPAAASYH
jgi:hypothetical protein